MQSYLLSSATLAPVAYYTYLYHAQQVIIEICDTYIKQTYRNRFEIATPQGRKALTIPVEKPSIGKDCMKDIRISSHGHWNHLHWQALLSAYNKSPFFDYYADDYAPLFFTPEKFLIDFNEKLLRTTLRLLHLSPSISYTTTYLSTPPPSCCDLREVIHPKKDIKELGTRFTSIPYYQVFERQNGFIPNLSIVDLLFNMGPESVLILRESFLQ